MMEARGISKSFPDVVANSDVHFRLASGEIHALLGENGAGKTTLASILSGLYKPDSGDILLEGQRVRFRSPRDALSMGIGMVHQHFRLVERFTVAENVALGDRTQPILLAPSRIREKVRSIGTQYGLTLPSDQPVARLSVGERQRVEIIKMLYRGVDILFLDEPTSGLTPQESQALFATMRVMAERGKSVVFISHKLREVMEVVDRVTIMHSGRSITTLPKSDTNPEELARLMIGRELEDRPAIESRSTPREKLMLSVKNLRVEPIGDRGLLNGVSFGVRAGEIVGIAGVAGNGQRELAEAISGVQEPDSGQVFVAGKETTRGGPRLVRAAGLAYIPEDRLRTGLAPHLSIAENLCLTSRRRFFFSVKGAVPQARRIIDEFDIRTTGPLARTSNLSGGNVQKVLLGRELSSNPSALIVASPTRGLDVGSALFVRGLLDHHRELGCGILLISEDLDEILTMSDRILVLYEGTIRHETAGGGDADISKIGLAMVGAM